MNGDIVSEIAEGLGNFVSLYQFEILLFIVICMTLYYIVKEVYKDKE